jgi:hypothetical protein
MYIRNYTSSLIFFAYWDRRPKTHACRQAGKTETPKYQFVANILSFLPTGKVADNQKK